MKVIYHRADLDGIGSAALIYNHLKENPVDNLEFIGADYRDDMDALIAKVDVDEEVIITDFCLEPFDKMLELYDKTKNIVWLDHHKSSLEHYKEAHEAGKINLAGLRPDYNDGRAGIYLTWQYFYNKDYVPLFVKYISRFDTWTHDNNEDIINFYVGSELKLSNFKDKLWTEFIEKNKTFNLMQSNESAIMLNKIIEDGELVNKYNKLRFAEVAQEGAFEVEILGEKLIALNTPFRGSYQLYSVYDKTKHDGMLVFTYLGDTWRYSVYAENGTKIECDRIAKHFGGGGHKGAAGFETDELIPEIQEKFKDINSLLDKIPTVPSLGKDFCGECGAEQKYIPNPMYMHKCTNCGKEIGSNGLVHKTYRELLKELLND